MSCLLPDHRSPTKPSTTSFTALWLPLPSLLNGTRWCAGPGTGKTRGIAITMVWPHLWRGLSAIVMDHTGALASLVLQSILFFREGIQRQLWQRIKYVDMAATDYIVPMPLYHRRGNESSFAVADRFVQVIARHDEYLATASIEGLNAIKEVGVYGGMLMVALGLQVTELADLLSNPKSWTARLQEAQHAVPEVRPAVAYFQQFANLTPEVRRRRTSSFLNQLVRFADPAMRAMYAAKRPGIDWAEAIRQGRTVLLDFGGETDRERRQFKLIWCFLEILEALKSRGPGGRKQPVLFVIDEVSDLLAPRSGDRSILGQDLHDLCTVWARNVGVKLCFAHQYPSQLEPTIQHAFAQLGTQVIGNIQDPDDALFLARQLHYYDPYAVKKTDAVWMNVAEGPGLDPVAEPTIIDYRTTEFTADEQFLLVADGIRCLPKFHFLVRPAAGEGNLTGRVRRMSLERLDAGLYPDEALLTEVRRRLRQRDGVPVATLLTEIRQRWQATVPVKTKKRPATLRKGEHTAHDPQSAHPLPAQERERRSQPAQPAESPIGANDGWQDDLWQKS